MSELKTVLQTILKIGTITYLSIQKWETEKSSTTETETKRCQTYTMPIYIPPTKTNKEHK